MSYNKSATKKTPAPRQRVTYKDYMAEAKQISEWYPEHNTQITNIERTDFPETNGVRWVATVTVGHTDGEQSAVVYALKYVNILFPGVFNPKVWEIRGQAEPTFEISWYTNRPQGD